MPLLSPTPLCPRHSVTFNYTQTCPSKAEPGARLRRSDRAGAEEFHTTAQAFSTSLTHFPCFLCFFGFALGSSGQAGLGESTASSRARKSQKSSFTHFLIHSLHNIRVDTPQGSELWSQQPGGTGSLLPAGGTGWLSQVVAPGQHGTWGVTP